MEKYRVRWSDLPPELWPLIGKHLDTYIDVLRFRSVCRSWRASLPPLNAISPLHFPYYSYSTTAANRRIDALLFRRIIYHLTPLHDDRISSSSAAEGWFAMVESTEPGKMRFQDLLSNRYVKLDNANRALRNEVNWLDFRIHEVAQSYTLEYSHTVGFPVSGVIKVVMSPDSVWTDLRNCTIVAVYDGGKLGFAKHGDDSWTLIDDQNFQYEDVIVYKGQVCAVDIRGTVSWIDSSMKLEQSSSELPDGNPTHLVESGGKLYAVQELMIVNYWEVIDIKVHRLIQKRGRWEEVKNLGDQAFVIGKGCCFSVSAPDFKGLKGNRIYFAKARRYNVRHRCYAFDLEKRRVSEASIHGNAQIFEPPRIFGPPRILLRTVYGHPSRWYD